MPSDAFKKLSGPDIKKFLKDYSCRIPNPEGFSGFDGMDDDDRSVTFFREEGTFDEDDSWHGREVRVTVEVWER